jgi:hypothetical protein
VSGSIRIRTVLRRTFVVYRARPFELVAASACVVASIAVLDLASIVPTVPPRLVLAVVDLAVLTLFTGFVVQATVEVFEGGRRQAPDLLLRAVIPMFGELILVGLVTGFAIGVLLSMASTLAFAAAITGVLNVGVSTGSIIAIAMVGIIVFFAPGLILMTIWSVVAPVIVLERPGRLRALRRSRQLVRGNRLRVLGTIMTLVVPLAIAARAIVFVGARIGAGGGTVATLVVTVLLAPIPVLCATALYYELRNVESAGVPQAVVAPSPAG